MGTGRDSVSSNAFPARFPRSRKAGVFLLAKSTLYEMFDQQRPLEEIAKALKRSERGIQFRMERLQLIDNAENYPETEEQTTRKDNEDLKKRYLSGQSIAEIAASYHISEKAVQARLFYLGLSSRKPD